MSTRLQAAWRGFIERRKHEDRLARARAEAAKAEHATTTGGWVRWLVGRSMRYRSAQRLAHSANSPAAVRKRRCPMHSHFSVHSPSHLHCVSCRHLNSASQAVVVYNVGVMCLRYHGETEEWAHTQQVRAPHIHILHLGTQHIPCTPSYAEPICATLFSVPLLPSGFG